MRALFACGVLVLLTGAASAQWEGVAAGTRAALSPQEVAKAQRNYMLHCMGCHLSDGRGAADKGVFDMRDTLGRFLALPGGRAFIVQVPGVMNSGLSDLETAQLMNWLLSTISHATVPPGTSPYVAEEIAQYRRTRPVDITASRRLLIEKMNASGAPVAGAAVN